jgi:hypothetical protein
MGKPEQAEVVERERAKHLINDNQGENRRDPEMGTIS